PLQTGVKSLPLLRSAAIYGPNAGGKSNLIKAMATMQRMVVNVSQLQDLLPVTPFKFNEQSAQTPTEFEVTIIVDGVRYQYGFSATAQAVQEEWLFAFPKGRAQLWFERSLQASGQYHYNFGDKLSGDKEVWQRATRANALFLTTAIQLNSQQLLPIFNWFAKTLRVIGVQGWAPHFSIACCQDERKEQIVDFLRSADFAISDIHVREEDFSPEYLPTELPGKMRSFLEYELAGKKELRLTTLHQGDQGQAVELDFTDESDGTRKMFSVAGPWLDSLSQGHVLLIDELHDNLHPMLVKFLVQLFHSPQSNPHQAQLIFSTHETAILNQEVFRRDQIWFCERDATQSTQLYSLTDFSPRKGVDNLERAYLAGRYGALPFLRDVQQKFGAH
ncbi:MAG: AAA family ATPase, partial [Shewanella sp.]